MNLSDPPRISPPRQTDNFLRRFIRRVVVGVGLLRPGARQAFFIAIALFIFSSAAIILTWSDRFYVDVPASGGTLKEGIIERPRFINPVLARSNADRNMTALIYSGLLRLMPNGEIIPDLAESYHVTPDGLTYSFTLKPDLFWHDGQPVTSADVMYTIEKVRDPALEIKSPRRASWDGVQVSAPDLQTVVFTLKQPYAPFLENATIGILPKHIWGNIADNEFDVSYYNLDPIGTGPYRIAKINQDAKKGLPVSYELRAFPGYARGAPYIETLLINFFGNSRDLFSAYENGTIQQFPTVDPDVAATIEANGGKITRMHLPLIDAAFFNQNQQPLFADKTIRKALALAVDRDRIVREVLLGYGQPVDGPISGLLPYPLSTSTPASVTETPPPQEAARTMLLDAGWVADAETGVLTKTDKKKKTSATLEFSISVPDVPELKHVAEILKEEWGGLGARVTIKIFETGTLGSEVLASRKYDILLYGIIGRPSDPYPYWHSSQRNAPGANIAMYTNRVADDLLEKIRRTSDPTQRDLLLLDLENEIKGDMPAVFLYRPDFLYATFAEVKGMTPGTVSVESDRFLDVSDWYLESERVWGILEENAKRVPRSESRLYLFLLQFFPGLVP